MSDKIDATVVIIMNRPGASSETIGTDDLTLEQAIKAEPIADALVLELRTAIGTKLRDERRRLQLSLEDVRDKSGTVDSGALSRVERGQRWSPDTARAAVAFYEKERRKQERKATRGAES